jgi:hypothetical protein
MDKQQLKDDILLSVFAFYGVVSFAIDVIRLA